MLFLLSLLFLLAGAQAQTLISGLDDVVRQAENTGLMSSSLKMLEKDVGYAGMDLLYQQHLERSEKKHFILLSAMPDFFSARVEEFLIKNKFPSAKFRLRNIFTDWSILSFKLTAVAGILKKEQDQLIFILDNSPASLDFSRALMEKYPKQVARIYLRQTLFKEVPAGIIPFITSLDIAFGELRAGNLSNQDVRELIQLLENAPDHLLIPSYSYCPLDYNPCQQGIFQSCDKFRNRIRSLCQARLVK